MPVLEKREEKEAMASVWETEKDVHEWKSSATQRDTKDDTASAQRQQDWQIILSGAQWIVF